MKSDIYVFSDPYSHKSVGVQSYFVYDDEGEVIQHCLRLLDREGTREVNAFSPSGKMICNIVKSKKKK